VKLFSLLATPAFLKSVDSIVGRLASHLLPSPAKPLSITCVRSILIIRPGGIGDAALLAPAIGLLKTHLPDTSIDVLAERRNAGVFSLVPGIRNLFLYDTPSDLIKVIGGDYDAVIDTEQWHRLSAVVARLTGAPVLIGFGTNERRKLFNNYVSYCHGDYEVNSFIHLLEPLGITAIWNESTPFLEIPEIIGQENSLSDKLLDERPYVAIFPGASIKERQWGMHHFREIVSRLEVEGVMVVVIGGVEDRAQGEEIVAGGRALNLAGTMNLAGTAKIISRAALLLSGDSGVLHLGVGLGVETISLFGPGIAAKWAPRGGQHTIINRCTPCSPCTRFGYTPVCQYNARCLAEIATDEVFTAIMLHLAKMDIRSAAK